MNTLSISQSYLKSAGSLLVATTFMLGTAALAGQVEPEINSLNPAKYPSIHVIVRYKGTPGTRNPASVAGATRMENVGDGELWQCTIAQAKALGALASVDYVALNHGLRATGIPVYDYLPETLQKSIKDGTVADSSTGRGVGIALIDSGVHVNQDLIGNGTSNNSGFPRVVYAQSFVPGESVDDLFGHGTHIAGIIAGDASNSFGPNYSHTIKGVAPGANIIS